MASVRDFFRINLLNNRYPALHGLRALAILGVLQVHVTVILSQNHVFWSPNRFVQAGLVRFAHLSGTAWFSMDMFFILSGFLIGGMFLHQDGLASGAEIRRFYVRRMFRTFPLYYVLLVAFAGLRPVPTAFRWVHLTEFLYLTNYDLIPEKWVIMEWGWSLCVEEHFYLAAPLLLGALHVARSHRARILAMGGIWCSALFVRLAIFYRQRFWNDIKLTHYFFNRSHTRYDILVAGILLAYLHHHYSDSLKETFRRWWVRAGAWLMFFYFFQSLIFTDIHPNYHLYRIIAWGTGSSLAFFPLVLLMLYTNGWFQRFMSWKIFRLIGSLGYGIYMTHIPIARHLLGPIAKRAHLAGLVTRYQAWFLMFIALVLVSYGVAYALHILIEKPALKLRDRWAPSLQKRPQAAAGPPAAS